MGSLSQENRLMAGAQYNLNDVFRIRVAIGHLQEVHALTHPEEQDETWTDRHGSASNAVAAEPQTRRERNHAEMERALVSRKRSRRR
ncbi:hypothetical protein NJB25_07275 [Escherichia fergusonii]|uniref:hypothetical protein n=2 Tax=Escherichia fergusonii TaxID=564 RepID=UPI00209B1CD3|nr:hypothetical protein [Escherichia fergusonii]MCO7833993.1 hypothetical protein [Escherichia fergusonii]